MYLNLQFKIYKSHYNLYKNLKNKPLNILKKKYEYQQVFMEFGEPELFTNHDIQQEMFNKIQNFICEIYNITGSLDVNAARLQLFINNYTVSDVNEEFNPKN